MGIMLYEGGWNKPDNASMLGNNGWSLAICREKKEQPLSQEQVQWQYFLPQGAVGSLGITGLGWDWVAVAPHLGGMGDPCSSTVPLASPFGFSNTQDREAW